MGPPGKSGKQGVMGPTGSKGETGLKGLTGTAGMKGAKGEPGESIAAPTVAVSPAKMTVNESKTASFQCSVSGNPKPVSIWSKLEGKSEKILLATTDGKLILPNAAGSVSGVYKCSASNILEQAQALVRLVVNSKLRYVNQLCWFSNRSKVKHYTEAVKLHKKSIYRGLYLHNEGEGKNISCIHVHVKHGFLFDG